MAVMFLLNQILVLAHPGSFCGLSPPQLKAGLNEQLLESVEGKYISGCRSGLTVCLAF